MSEDQRDMHTDEPLDEELYEDEYVDEDDEDAAEERRRRTRLVLGAIIALLALLLIGIGYAVLRLVTPPRAGKAGDEGTGGIEWVRSIYGYGPSESEQFLAPVDAAVGSDGTLWGVDAQRTRVLGFNPDGSFASVLHTGPSARGPGKLGIPEGIGADDKGDIYVSDPLNNKVMVFGPNGKVLREFTVPFPLEIAVRGSRVVVGSGPGFAVYDDKGTVLAIVGKRGQGPEEFHTVHGLAIGEDGTIYAADTNNARIKAYRADGTLLWVYPESRRNARKPGVQPGASTGPLMLPTSIAIDGQGRLVVCDSFAFELVVLQPSAKGAKLVARYGKFGSADGFFGYPTGIDYDPVRDYFVIADTANNRLQVVRIPGSAAPGLLPAARRFFSNWWSWCCLPLALLVVAILLAVWRRRRRDDEDEEEPDEASAAGSPDESEDWVDDEG